MANIVIEDAQGTYVGVVTLLKRDLNGGEGLYGYSVTRPGSVAANASSMLHGQEAAVAAAILAAGEIGVVGARVQE